MKVDILQDTMSAIGLNYLLDLWNNSTVCNNVISDGSTVETYASAQVIIRYYIEWLQDREFNQPINYYCEQSVDHALLLIAMSFSGLNFVLLSASSASEISSFGDEIYLDDTDKAHRWLEPRYVPQKIKFPINGDMTGCVFFRTSGSLDNPKTVIHEFKIGIKNSKNVLTRLPINKTDKVLIPVPICHMYGYGAALWPCLLSGANVYLAESMNLLTFRQIEKSYKPNVVFATPGMINALTKIGRKSISYKFVVSAGDCFDSSCFVSVKQKFNRVFDLYGSTELGVIAIGEVAMEDNIIVNAVQALPNVKVKINENQLVVNHDYGFQRYLHNKDNQSWFQTQDLIEKLSNDSFKVIGRADLSINREGRLISFRDVETRLKKSSFIEEIAIIKGDPDVKGSTMIALCQIQKPIESAQLRKKFYDLVSTSHIPSKVLIVNELPRLVNGKLDRKNLRKLI